MSSHLKRALLALAVDRNFSRKVRREALCALGTHGLDSAEGRFLLSMISSESLSLADKEMISAIENGIRIVTISEPDYPVELRSIVDPPIALYVREGALCVLAENVAVLRIAIVGTRQASRERLDFAENLSYELTKRGVHIVSGLAMGIDSAAHKGAIRASQDSRAQRCGFVYAGISVFGCGVLNIYPDRNRGIAQALVDNGGILVSEYGLYTKPRQHFFPERNRIISGLSHGVVVVEAKKRSGSLITARMALEQGREVFAVPGSPRVANTAGSNLLIKQGASLVENEDDVLEAFPWFVPEETCCEVEDSQLDSFEGLSGRIMKVLKTQKVTQVDVLIDALNELPHEIIQALTDMELSGTVYRYPGDYFSTQQFVDT